LDHWDKGLLGVGGGGIKKKKKRKHSPVGKKAAVAHGGQNLGEGKTYCREKGK